MHTQPVLRHSVRICGLSSTKKWACTKCNWRPFPFGPTLSLTCATRTNAGRAGSASSCMPLRRDQVAPKVQGGVFQRKGENIKGTRPQCCAETIDSQCGAVGEGSPIIIPTPVQALVPIEHDVNLDTLGRWSPWRGLRRRAWCAKGSTHRRYCASALSLCPLVVRVACSVLRVHES